jgi:hypothetical protein
MSTTQTKRLPWTPPTVKKLGQVGTVVKGGGGKLSIPTDDMGDVRKPQGQEGN